MAPDVLTNRLNTLVEAGVLERRPYQEEGRRTRQDYHVTPAGMDLRVVLGALQQWGDKHRPYQAGPTIVRRSADNRPLHVAYVDDEGHEIPLDEVHFLRAPTHPT